MKVFNYERAWEQFVHPEFTKLSPSIHILVDSVLQAAPDLKQVGASHWVEGPPGLVETLIEQFNQVPIEELAWASKVVYYSGHLAPSKRAGSLQESGMYWKFEILADQSLLKRGGNEALHQAKAKMGKRLKSFHDHKIGSEYDNDELPALVRELLPEVAETVEVVKADNINYKPHPFVIGPRHSPKAGRMYIDPHQAGCAHCGLPYEDHTSERALFVRPKVDHTTEIFKNALKDILRVLEDNSIKIDGFALIGGTA